MKEYRRIVLLDITEKCEELNSNNLYGIDDVRGVSNTKQFMKTKANVSDRDFSKFQIVKPDYFVFNRRTTRNGEKIGMGFNNSTDIYICTEDYVVFKIREDCKKNILPTYLYLFFLRNEFDRYARYHSSGSATEFFNWEDMQRVSLLVPDIKEQQKIVDTYNAITNRIQIKQKINENILKQGIQIVQNFVGNAIYSNKTDSEIEEIKDSLPMNQKMITIKEFCKNTKSGSTPSRTETDYWKNGNIPWLKSGEVHNNITVETEEYITEKATDETSTKLLPENTILMAMYGVTAGEVGYLGIEATTNQAICGMICNSLEDAAYLYFSLLQNQNEISSLANGGAQNNLSKELIENLKIVIPENITELKLNVLVRNLILNTKELQKLNQLKQLVVSQISKR